MLTDSVDVIDRVRVQGAGDALIWTGGALASIGSGWFLDRAGFAMLNVAGVVLSLAPVWLLYRVVRTGSVRPSVPG